MQSLLQRIHKRVEKEIQPARLILYGFLVVIAIGTLLLNLPIASANGRSIGLLDAFFTATSASCVTGLVLVNTLEQWSVFGKVVLLFLIQIGGLGFMTFVTLGFLLIRKRITLRDRMLIRESYNQNTLQGMVQYVQNLFLGTLLIEAVGALILAIRFYPQYGLKTSVAYGVFHSISAFCNAGFDLIGTHSLRSYSGDGIAMLTVMLLVVIGGLGFGVWMDTLRIFQLKLSVKLPWMHAVRRLSLHSKIVYTMTPGLILSGAVFYLLYEAGNPNTLGGLPFGQKVLDSFMQSVNLRTAGFTTIDPTQMTEGTRFLSMLWMLIGGSPGGTAGGIKTVTLGVLLITVLSVLKGNQNTHVFHRSIPFDTLQKSLAIFFISLCAWILLAVLLSLTEHALLGRYDFIDFLFESASALSTCGISVGITAELSSAGKLLMAVAMFIGRIGPISIVLGLTKKKGLTKNHIEYPENHVMVG